MKGGDEDDTDVSFPSSSAKTLINDTTMTSSTNHSFSRGQAQPGCSQEIVQWTHLQFISFAIAPVVLLVVLLLKNDIGGAIANEPTVVRCKDPAY